MRGALVGAQIALCTMLLIPAGLLSRALHAAHQFEPGFDFSNVAVLSIEFRGPRYEQGNGALATEQWIERIRGLAGVERLAQASRAPLSPGRSQTTFRMGDEPEGRIAEVNSVSPDFFALLGMVVVHGRLFAEGEVDAALVTESTARRYWPGQDPVGRVITIDIGAARSSASSVTRNSHRRRTRSRAICSCQRREVTREASRS